MSWAEDDAVSVLSSPFTDERFVAGIASVFNWSVRPFHTNLGLGALLVERKTGPASEFVLPPFTPHTALTWLPAGRHTLFTEALQSLCSQVADTGIPALLSLPPGMSPENIALAELTPAGWRWQDKYTCRMQTGDTASTLPLYSSGTRRLYRKHVTDYVCAETPDTVSRTIELVALSYGRHHRSIPASPDRLKDLAHLMMASGRARAFSATNMSTGKVEAGIVVLFRQQTAWYWMSGSEPGPAMTVLLTEVLDMLGHHGVDTFDLMGANTPSIAEFKRRFGAERVRYGHLSTPGRGLSAGLASLRRVWRTLPRRS